MNNIDLNLLSSGSIGQKIKTLQHIGDFNITTASNVVASLATTPAESGRVKKQALRTLAILGYPSLNEILLSIFHNDKDKEIRHEMALTMGDSGDCLFVDYLLQLLKNEQENYNVRYASALSLGKLEDKRVIPELTQLLGSITNSVIKSGLIFALKDLDAVETIELIADELLRGDKIIRIAAIRALSKLGNKNIIPQLELMKQDDTQTWAGKINELADAAIANILSKNNPDQSKKE